MKTPEAVTVFAPAKVNLTLHITGRRDDGYHLLDSVVVFARDIGDRITVSAAPETSLTVTGPFATDVPTSVDNLVLRAARLLDTPAAIILDKNLPVASGIGGGSADAAATLHALSKLGNRPLPDRDAQLALGADVPACVAGGVLRMRGIGDRLDVMDSAAFSVPMVLVNPRIAVSTARVFQALASREGAPMPDALPAPQDEAAFLDAMARGRNDLEAPALSVAPDIRDVLAALHRTSGAALVRMSGSGATCFALYPDERDAATAVETLQRIHPEWWTVLATA